MHLEETKYSEDVTHVAGHHLAWNSLLNLGTSFVIVGLNFLFVPWMLHYFGTELYGVLSVTWMVLANFNWLDFGFSRASARYVAQELARGRFSDAALWTFTAGVSQAALGSLGALLIWSLAPFIVSHIHVHQQNEQLVILTVRLFALCVPIDFAGRSLFGVLQAGQRFDWVNGLTIFNSISTFSIYGVGIIFGANFKVVIYGLVLLRIANLLLTCWGALHVIPNLKDLSCLVGLTESYHSRVVTLARYGLWVTLASVAVPLLLFCDQWMITLLIGVSLLPYYTVPNNLMWRLGVLPNSLTSTLFPAFSAMEAQAESGRIENYFVRVNRYLITCLIPMLFILFVWGGEILRLWISPDFAAHSTIPMRVLVPGFLVGLLAPLCGTVLEAIGRPDLLVKIYLIEVPFNVLIVWSLTKHWGLAGAALSYTVRTLIETVILFAVLYRTVPFSGRRLITRAFSRPISALIPLALVAFWLRSPNIGDPVAVGVTLAILTGYSLFAYFIVFDTEDLAFFKSLYKMKKNRFIGARFTRAA